MLARQNIKICTEMQGKATSKSDMFVLGALGAPMASPLPLFDPVDIFRL